jgi:plasmid stabilization system protein ParE
MPSLYDVSAEAQNDLFEIWRHIAEDSVDLANRINSEFHDLFAALGRMPGQGHARKDLTTRPVLFFPLPLGANPRARDPERLRSEWPSQGTGPRQSGQAVDGVSDNHQLQLRSDSPEIVGVAGYHGLPGPLRTDGDVGIDNVGRPGSCQQ